MINSIFLADEWQNVTKQWTLSQVLLKNFDNRSEMFYNFLEKTYFAQHYQ